VRISPHNYSRPVRQEKARRAERAHLGGSRADVGANNSGLGNVLVGLTLTRSTTAFIREGNDFWIAVVDQIVDTAGRALVSHQRTEDAFRGLSMTRPGGSACLGDGPVLSRFVNAWLAPRASNLCCSMISATYLCASRRADWSHGTCFALGDRPRLRCVHSSERQEDDCGSHGDAMARVLGERELLVTQGPRRPR
jgi:hypothetical protein